MAFGVTFVRIAFRHPGAAIPDHHGAAAIFAFRDRTLEGVVFDRMVLDVDGEAFFVGIQAGAAGHRPALHHAVEFKPQIVMQPRRRVLLNDIAVAAARGLCGRAAPVSRRIFAFFGKFRGPRDFNPSRWSLSHAPIRARTTARISQCGRVPGHGKTRLTAQHKRLGKTREFPVGSGKRRRPKLRCQRGMVYTLRVYAFGYGRWRQAGPIPIIAIRPKGQ